MNTPCVTVGYNGGMDEKYRLVFRGEVQDGQHRAVVKRRLMEALKLESAQAEKLFSGKAVVLKRESDTRTAARYQALFNKAGARLRVLPVEADDPALAHVGASPVADAPDPTAPGPRPAAAASATASTPASATIPEQAGKSVTTSAADPVSPTPAVDAILARSNLSLQDNAELDRLVADAAGDVVEIEAPDYELAELGAMLADAVEAVIAEIPDVDLTLADIGADILIERAETEPQIAVDTIDFDVADVGADIGPPAEDSAPPTPDTSHLQLEQA